MSQQQSDGLSHLDRSQIHPTDPPAAHAVAGWFAGLSGVSVIVSPYERCTVQWQYWKHGYQCGVDERVRLNRQSKPGFFRWGRRP